MRSREVALRILDELFRGARTGEGEVPTSAYTLAAFQWEGVARLQGILDRYGGAVLADDVGLGKTYMALALVESEIQRGGDAVIVVPAATRRAWRRALGGLADVRGSWRLLSHTQLARGAETGPPRESRLVVVDEAHRFRNPDTLRHSALARLAMPPARLLLLTATPVNNGLDDLQHLLRLFLPDPAFRDLGVPSLNGAFEEADPAARGAGHAVEALARIVDAVVVRRTRAMVRTRFGDRAPGALDQDGPRFPRRAAPRSIRYTHPGLRRQAERIGALELAPYDLGRFGALGGAAGPGSVPALLRLGLVKRLDSSAAALQASLQRLDTVLRDALAAAYVGRLPVARWRRPRSGDGDPLQLALTPLVTRPAPPAVALDALAASIRRDLHRVRELRRSDDPKLQALIRLLEEIHEEKVLVFTEYRDTAHALWDGLSPRFRVARVDGSGAWLGRRPAGRRTVVDRFAPHANGRRPPPDRERVDVLVATDVLAEGLNLQDGRHVVSYDLPWNPVRLLQRIGRLDRLGSPHDEIVPYLFLPAEGLDAVLGLTRRLRSKLGDIARTVGGGETSALYARLSGETPELARPPGAGAPRVRVPGKLPWGPDEHDPGCEAKEAGDAPMERLRTLWVRHRSPTWSSPPYEASPCADGSPRSPRSPCSPMTARVRLPQRAGETPGSGPRGRRPDQPWPEWVVLAAAEPGPEPTRAGAAGRAARHSRRTALLEVDHQGGVRMAGRAAAAVLEAALADPGAGSRAPPQLPTRAVHDYLRSRAGTGAAPAPLSGHDPGRRLALELRRRLRREGARVDRRTITRADALQLRLAAPLDGHARRAIRSALEGGASRSLTELLDRAERALEAVGPRPVRTAPAALSWTMVAALYIERIHTPRTPPRGG